MRRWQVLLIAGGIGVASLLLVPFETLINRPIPPLALRLLACVQPALLLAVAVFVGELTARPTKLRAPLVEAWLAGDRSGAVLRRQLPPALAAGVAVALILVGYDRTIGRELLAGAGAHSRLAAFDLPLATKLLYGGLGEELIARWGLVSALTWVGWRVAGRPRQTPAWALTAAVALAALLFAAGHLPLLFLVAPSASPAIVAAVLAGNAIPGLLFGWLFVRSGLEAAAIAHMAAHFLAFLALAAA